MMNALLVRFGGLGDLLVALPSLRLIRGKYPDARLTLACRAEYGGLVRERGVADLIIPEDSRVLMPLFREALEAEAKDCDWLESFDLVIGWTHGARGGFLKGGVAGGGARPKIRLIHAGPRVSEPLSLFFFRKTAEALGETGGLSLDEWNRLPERVRAGAGEPEGAERGTGKRERAVVHPGSGSENKRWPFARFLEIITRFGERGVGGALVTGEAEEGMAAEVGRAVLPPNWSWVRRPGLGDLARLLSKAMLYVGNDCGVTHLAAACGAEVVAMFRREFALAWRPAGRVHLHVAGSPSDITSESVWQTIASRLPNFSADSQKC
jgi:ADP-heptose:LPS heptosyltransferase